MNIETELAFKTWLAASAGMAGVLIECGQSDYIVPEDDQMVVISCISSKSPAHGLFVADIQIACATPVLMVDGLTVHRALSSAIRTALSDTIALPSCFPAGLYLAGITLGGWTESQAGGKWQSATDLTAGIAEVEI